MIRFAHPELDILSHTVKVNYKVLRLRDGRVLDEVDEHHVMRFLFPQEVEHYLRAGRVPPATVVSSYGAR